MEPKTYEKKEHGIDINLIDSKALYVLEKLSLSGYTAYLVGGSVRDLLLGHKPKDFDISTSAKPEEIKALFPSSILIGKRFRLAHVRFGKKVLEVSTFRAGDIEKEELIEEDNIWGNPEEDVLRRDFTINGLFYNSKEETVIDYVDGYPDLKKKYLRTIGQPFLRFKQDPVRMIRCLKFQARFGFEVDEKARLALIDCKGEILKSSKARVLEELLRMLESGASKPFFKLMADHGLIDPLLPLIGQFLETPEGEEAYSFLEEVDRATKDPRFSPFNRSVLLSCLLFPLVEKKLKIHFLDRERVPHLGDILQEVSRITDEVFEPFFHLPRRLKMGVVSLLTSQYRITPFTKKKGGKIRVPHIPDFDLALQFFKLRCCLEPGLKEIGELWTNAYEEEKKKMFSHPEHLPQNRRKRRPKRRHFGT